MSHASPDPASSRRSSGISGARLKRPRPRKAPPPYRPSPIWCSRLPPGSGPDIKNRFSSIFICRHHGKTQNPRENHRRQGQLPGHAGMDRGIRRPSPHRYRGTGLDSLKSRRTGAPGRLRTPPQGRNRAHPGLRPLRSGHPAPPGAFFCPILRTCITHRYAGRAPNPSRWTIPGGFCQILRKHDEILTNWPKYPHFSLVWADFLGREARRAR